jgi:flagellar protein FliS
MRKNVKAYQNVNIKSTMAAADPHQIISMMYNGLLESLAQAKGAIERKDLENKSKLLTKAVSIIQALQNSLDSESEPVISKNFNELYSHCIMRINDASLSLDIAMIDEVVTFIAPLRDAWQQMPEQAKQDGLNLLKEKESARANAVGV